MTFQVNWDEGSVQLSVPADRVKPHARAQGEVVARMEFPLEEAAALHGELGRAINEALRLAVSRAS